MDDAWLLVLCRIEHVFDSEIDAPKIAVGHRVTEEDKPIADQVAPKKLRHRGIETVRVPFHQQRSPRRLSVEMDHWDLVTRRSFVDLGQLIVGDRNTARIERSLDEVIEVRGVDARYQSVGGESCQRGVP